MDTNDTLELIKKDIRRIRRSGISAEILGWLLIVSGGVVAWFSSTTRDAMIGAAILLVIGLYYVYTGQYLKDGRGRRVKFALLLNGIIAIPLCAAIVPIYVCVQSINNYSRFKELPDNIRALYTKPKRLKLKLSDVIGLIIALLIAGTLLGLKIEKIHKANEVISANNPNQPIVAKESAYNFTIKFPALPVPTNFTEQESGQTITYTTYDTAIDHGAQVYDVYAYNWPTSYFNFNAMSQFALQATLNSSLTSIVQGLRGSNVVSTPSTFLGHPSDDAQFTSPTFNSSITGYIKVFYIGNNEYAILSLGATQTNFNNFLDSFQYNGK